MYVWESKGNWGGQKEGSLWNLMSCLGGRDGGQGVQVGKSSSAGLGISCDIQELRFEPPAGTPEAGA